MDQSQNWEVGKKKTIGLRKGPERAVIIGLSRGDQDMGQTMEYLEELEFLATTAGADTIQRFVQKLDHPHQKYFIGSGKLEEVKTFVEDNDIDLVIFDDDLTGKQQNILERELKRKIVDRSTLILDIFASRAQTAQAKTQVELAQIQYLLPRLRGLWTHLERQRGGIGMRGPGEQEIETDRRIVRDKIGLLKTKLEKIDQQNRTQRKNRGEFIRVALVGYTNVGKSTLMNLLSKSEVFAENKLFATLDTTVRKVVIERTPFLISDTVGFIRKLPHHLIESFKSTLDEVRESDILLHVIDISHPQYEDHLATVQQTLKELNVLDRPTLLVFNKMDLYRDKTYDDLISRAERWEMDAEMQEKMQHQFDHDQVFISAQTGENIDALKEKLVSMVRRQYDQRYPYKTMYW